MTKGKSRNRVARGAKAITRVARAKAKCYDHRGYDGSSSEEA